MSPKKALKKMRREYQTQSNRSDNENPIMHKLLKNDVEDLEDFAVSLHRGFLTRYVLHQHPSTVKKANLQFSVIKNCRHLGFHSNFAVIFLDFFLCFVHVELHGLLWRNVRCGSSAKPNHLYGQLACRFAVFEPAQTFSPMATA